MPYFDAHCHIAPEPGPAAKELPPESAFAGRLLCGTTPADWHKVAAFCNQPENKATPAFGLHPWEISGAPENWLDTLSACLEDNPSAWLGEAGLDKIKVMDAPFDRQKEVLATQLNLARDLGRPVSLHCVRAWEELLPLLDGEFLTGQNVFVMHAFSGPDTYLKAFAARGGYFSLGCAVLDKAFKRQRAAAAAIPFDRLLIESDTYVQTRYDGLSDLQAVSREIAAIRSLDEEELAGIVLENTRKVLIHDR
jgi:Mg-dependent DNase